MTTSLIPPNYPHPFTKDSLEGNYHGFRREIWSQSAYDTEKACKGVWLGFALIGPNSAITAGIFTDFYLPETIEKWGEQGIKNYHPHGMGGVVDFHWNSPIEDIEPRDDCTLVKGQCWSIATITLSDQIVEALCREGFDGVWHDLHEILADQTKVQQERE